MEGKNIASPSFTSTADESLGRKVGNPSSRSSSSSSPGYFSTVIPPASTVCWRHPFPGVRRPLRSRFAATRSALDRFPFYASCVIAESKGDPLIQSVKIASFGYRCGDMVICIPIRSILINIGSFRCLISWVSNGRVT